MRATTKLFTILGLAAALAPMVPASAAVTEAAIANFSFSPNPLTITAGDTVKWTNTDNATHTVTADDGSFGSPSLNAQGTFSHTFSQTGTFAYHCDIHPSMQGTVQVAAQSTTTTTASAPPTTVTTRATTTSTAPRSTTTVPRPTTTVTAAPTTTTVAPVAPTNPPTTGATPLPSETTTSTLVAAGAADDDGRGSGSNGGMLAAGAALLLLAGAGGWWAIRRRQSAGTGG